MSGKNKKSKDEMPVYDAHEQGVAQDFKIVPAGTRANRQRVARYDGTRQALIDRLNGRKSGPADDVLQGLFGQHLGAAANGCPLHIGIYLRVSTEEQAKVGGTAEGFSIPYQRKVCHEKAEQMGGVVTDEYVELGVSAKSTRRPELQRLLADIRAKQIQVVLVHKIDRLARNSKDAHAIQAEIVEAGAVLVSVMEYIDDSPAGKLNYAIQAGVAQYHVDNLTLEVKKGMGTKASTGGTPYRTPLGYLNKQRVENNVVIRYVEIDRERAPLIRWAFREYATGSWTLLRLLAALTEKGLRTRKTHKQPAKLLSESVLHSILRSPYYMGVLPYCGVYYDGNHEPLVDPETWLQVQDVLSAHNKAGEKDRRHPHYLKGTIWCGGCGSRLIFSRNKGHGGVYDYFLCIGRQQKRTSCTRPAVRVEAIEAGVERYYAHFQLHPSKVERIREGVLAELQEERVQAEEDRQRATRLVTSLKDERKALLHAHYAEAIPPDLLKEEMDRLTREIAHAEVEVRKANTTLDELQQTLTRALYVAGTCQAQYKGALPHIRRQINQGFFKKLYINTDGSVERADLTEPFAQVLGEKLGEATVVADSRDTADALQHPRSDESEMDSDVLDTTFEERCRPSNVLVRTFGETTGETIMPDDDLVWEGVSEGGLVPPAGFEPATTWFEAKYSDPLSYGGVE